MKTMEVAIYVNDRGSDYRFTLKTKCKSCADLLFVQKSINGFFDKEILAEEGEKETDENR